MFALETCIGRLPEHSAQLVREHYISAVPLVEIARRTGKTEVAVRVALMRVRVWLRECIARHLVVDCAAAAERQRP